MKCSLFLLHYIDIAIVFLKIYQVICERYLTQFYPASEFLTTTIVIDCEKDDEVYNAICKKYEDELGNPLSKDAVFWSVSYEIALKNYKAVKQMWDDELKD